MPPERIGPDARMPRARMSVDAYVDGIRRGDRAVLARAITLVESQRHDDAAPAAELLDAVLPFTGQARRVGITGVPGAGKSTLIDALGQHLVHDLGERVAVLSVDPSSPVTGGSLLGDKTRMARLAVDERAFVRPSPSRGHPGGVALRTREAIMLCEAAGYQTILVETVGVGQSETAARDLTDVFVLLLLPGAGDELQGLKRGIVEMADLLAITKADGATRAAAERACEDYGRALHLFPPSADGWAPRVLTTSALDGAGIPELWEGILAHQAHAEAGGHRLARRREQAVSWMRELVRVGLGRAIASNPEASAHVADLERRVAAFEVSAVAAASDLLIALLVSE